MYKSHFSFKYKPFELVPNADFLFLSPTHQKAMTYLDYGIKEKIGFILLTGEIGSGKTTIIRNLIKNLNPSVKLSRINNTKVNSEELISLINEDFGLDVKEKQSKTKLLSELSNFLIEQYSKGIQPVLLIDEAQNLSADLLEEIRLLSNLETDKAKLLQIILVGQPELKKTLMLPELMQLRQRININYHISPLTAEETGQYIKHRLTIAGNPDAILIDDEGLKIIHTFSRGIPRLINILCDFALLTTYVENRTEADADIIRGVAKDLESYDYWNDSEAGTNGKEVSAEYIGSTESIALRLIELEEKVKKNASELEYLANKLSHWEKVISRGDSEKTRKELSELSKRISSLENITNTENNNRLTTLPEPAGEASIAGQAESLKIMLKSINHKLK